jgi:hypothetical protein
MSQEEPVRSRVYDSAYPQVPLSRPFSTIAAPMRAQEYS